MSGNEKHTVAAAHIFLFAYARYFGCILGFAFMCLKSVSLQSFFVRFCMGEHLTVCVSSVTLFIRVFPCHCQSVFHMRGLVFSCLSPRTCACEDCFRMRCVGLHPCFFESANSGAWCSSRLGRGGDAHKHILRSHTAKHSRKKSHPRQLPPPLLPPL